MSYTPGYWTCDICREHIDERDMVTLAVRGGVRVSRDVPGYLGHYHPDCWHCVADAVGAAALPDEVETVEPGAGQRTPEGDCWSDLPRAAREHLVYQALDGCKLTIREITERLAELLPPRIRRDHQGQLMTEQPIYEGEVRSVVSKLFKSGQLTREPEIFQKTKTRYRYFLPPLTGPIADLERALADQTDGEAV